MPHYDYFCPENGETVEVYHPMDVSLKTWGEVCFAAQIRLGDTGSDAPVRRVIHAPYVNVPVSDSRLKEVGFTKLVRRDEGVYENVTATDDESRYMKADDRSTLPTLHKKIRD